MFQQKVFMSKKKELYRIDYLDLDYEKKYNIILFSGKPRTSLLSVNFIKFVTVQNSFILRGNKYPNIIKEQRFFILLNLL